jgi:hypothetical protein
MRRRMRLATKEAIIKSIRKSTRDGKSTKKASVLEFLLERKQDSENNPEIKATGTMTLDDVWYHLRKYKFIPNEIEITEDTRRSVKAYIAELCDLLGFRREQLGIIAQPFGTLYFRGDSWDITIDQLESLKYLGAYVVIIEKEGIVQSLKPFADKYGIALLSSHGFLTENAADLSNLIKGVEGNVAILTDYDISGLLIALNIHGIHRIGIDSETLRYFGHNIDLQNLRTFDEGYAPNKGHWGGIIQHATNKSKLPTVYRDLLSKENLEYLSTRRIEINSVKTEVGNKRFWDFIMYSLRKIFSETDYTRAIDVDELAKVWPDPIVRLNRLVAEWRANIIGDIVEDHRNMLSSYDGRVEDEVNLSKEEKSDRRIRGLQLGFIEVAKYEAMMIRDFKELLEEDGDLGPAMKQVEKLTKKLENEKAEDKGENK